MNKKRSWELITQGASIFAMSDIDYGKAFLVEHSINL